MRVAAAGYRRPRLLHSHVMPLALLLIAVASFLLGSVPTGYLLVRIFHKQDIRDLGSGNIGATNVVRAGGKKLGAAMATQLAPAFPVRNAEALAALCAVLGHMFTPWLNFRGGKGVATGFGVFLVAAPLAALAAIGLFAVIFALSRYVSLGSIIAAASFPVFAWFLVRGDRPAFFLLVQALVALLIIVKHHQNIRRLFAGTEVRIGDHKLK